LLLGLNACRRGLHWLKTGHWVTPEQVEPAYQHAHVYQSLKKGDTV
jgi:hypothetical protein